MLLHPEDKRIVGGCRAAHVEHQTVFDSLRHLALAGGTGELLVEVEEHAHASRGLWVAAANQTAGRG